MKNNKNITLIQIVIFLLLSFAPVFLADRLWLDDNANFKYATASFLAMLYPAFANIITRLVTKEGLNESFLKISFKVNLKIYILSFIMPIANAVLAAIIFIIFYGIKPHYPSASVLTAALLSSLASTPAYFFMGFGEEFGWRAYLTPKLKKLMPNILAIIITGLIWGLWHTPLIVRGYNFGKDYKGFPYLGVIAMCLSCMALSFIFTYLTDKCNSVYPAAICHIVFDCMTNVIFTLTVSDAISISKHYFVSSLLIMLIAPTLIAVVGGLFVMLSSKKRGDFS